MGNYAPNSFMTQPAHLPPLLTSHGKSLGLVKSWPLMTRWPWLLKGTHPRLEGFKAFTWTRNWTALTCTYWCHLCSPTRHTMVAPLKYKEQTGSTKSIGRYQWFHELEYLGWLVVMLFYALFIMMYPRVMH